jgi:hypothetical protein
MIHLNWPISRVQYFALLQEGPYKRSPSPKKGPLFEKKKGSMNFLKAPKNPNKIA